MNRHLAGLYSDLVQVARGWNYRPVLHDLEQSQWIEPSEMAQRRSRKLRALMEHCHANVPFYRDELDRLGMTGSDINSEADLSGLPIIDKQMLRSDYQRFFSTDRERPFDVWSTSGSTGEPFGFRLDKSAITANTFANLARGRRWWGLDFGVREVMIWSSVRDISQTWRGRLMAARRRLSWGLKNIYVVDTYNLDRDQVSEQYHQLLRFRPVASRSISSGLFRFCSLLDELGLDGRALGIRHAIYTGEAFPPAQRELVERVLACKTICEYGCSEVGIIAFECPRGGLHLCHEGLILELIKDGRPAEVGEEAELVVTNLNEFVAPLVRYAVGDVVVPAKGPCPCGRTLPLIEKVGGRSHASIATPKGGVLHGLFFTHLFDNLPVVSQFRVVQEKTDELRIELYSPETIPDSARDYIHSTVTDAMGGNARVDVCQVPELALAHNGKFQWIVSNVEASESA